jgi:hypothetical protein
MVNSRRTSTIVPQQALFYMNSPMTINAARKVTQLPAFVQASGIDDRVKVIYANLFQRSPQPREIQFARDFLLSAGWTDPTTQPSRPSPALIKQREREAKAEQAYIDRQKKQLEAMANQRFDLRRTLRNSEGDFVSRKPLAPWEQYAQALLFTNEIAYVN